MWKILRSVVFKTLLGYDTTPKESAFAFGLSFYNVVVRPLLKMIERNKIAVNNESEDTFLWEPVKEAMKVRLLKEENHTEEIKKAIVENIEGKNRYKVEI